MQFSALLHFRHWIHGSARLAVALLFLLVAGGGWPGLAQAEESQEKADGAKQELDRLRQEIRDYENRLKESRSKEQDLLGELENLEREVTLRSRLMQRLEAEKKRTQKALEASLRELESIQGHLTNTRQDSLRTQLDREALSDLVARRAVYTYKHFHRDMLKAALTSGSLMQWLTRQEYLKRIAAADQNNLDQLQRKNVKLAAIGSDLARRESAESTRLQKYQEIAAYKEKLLRESASEAAVLKKRRTERESLLKRLQQDRVMLAKQLQEKKDAASRVQNLIASLEAKRAKSSTSLPLPKGTALDLPFPQLKGKMEWPTPGKIVAKFGLQRHEKLATVTENPGIDIEAVEGTPVIAVCSGEVTKITWLRGYGNTVIVDHRDGYYTVYAHLDEIQVREGQGVSAGDGLGSVGSSGSVTGPRLHFEIWVKREKQDPLDWLAKK